MPTPHKTRSSGGNRNAKSGFGRGRLMISRGRKVVEPPPCPDGKVRCPVCRNVTTPLRSGRLRKHADLFGHECYNRRSPEVGIE